MQIGFDAKRIFHNFSGLGNYGRTLVETLAQQNRSEQHYLFTPKENQHPLLTFIHQENIHTILPKGMYNYLPKSLWRTYGINSELKKLNIDLYHGLSAELPAGQLPCKSVVTIHDTIFLRYPQLYSKIDRAVYTRKTAHACQKADKIIAISKQTASDLTAFFHADSHKIEIIYQSCDAIFRKEVTELEKTTVIEKYKLSLPYLITIGTIEERKNTLNLIKALKNVNPEFHLVLVGKPTLYQSKVQELINELGLQTRVTIINNAQFQDFPALYAAATASVYPSIFEGFGIPVIEAQSLGTPVLTSNISSMPEAGGEAAIYFNPHNPDEITAQINTLINDNTALRQFSEAGKVHVEKFHPCAIGEEVRAVYEL